MRLRSHNTDGSFLIAAMLLSLIGAWAAVAMVAYSRDMHKLNERTVASEKAVATAEAGLYKLVHYFNHPEDMPANCGTQAAAVNGFLNGGAASTVTAGSGQTFINRDAGLNADLVAFTPQGATAPSSRVTLLQIVGPQAASGNWAASPAIGVFRFIAVAEAYTTTGDTIQRTALMDVGFQQGSRLSVPAGLVAGGTAAANGHFNLHWGAAWAKGNLSIKANAKWRRGAWSTTGDNTVNRGSGDTWVTYESAQGYVCSHNGDPIYDDSSVYDVGASNSTGDYTDTLYQFVDDFTAPGDPTLTEQIDAVLSEFTTLNDAQKGYEFWKQAAIARDAYFAPSGNGYVDNLGHTYNSVADALDAYRYRDDCYVAFFDTTDGQPPAADGSNMIDASYSGGVDLRTQGLLYFCGSLSISGAGNPPSIPVKNPDEVTNDQPASTNVNVYHDGIVFTWGDYRNTGNNVIYGSVITNGNYDGGGTPNIYYNEALRSGQPQPLSSAVNVLQRQL